MSNPFRQIAGRFHNKLLARQFRRTASQPRFVIVGTGRSGTNYIADRLSAAGIDCLHERFFSTDGPNFDLEDKRCDYRGESSWLAVPYLPMERIPLAHITRHPFGVIKSFYNIGFFHSEKYGDQAAFVRFAKHHFTFSSDPLRSSMRWYIEWNAKCRELTKNHVRVEEIDDRFEEFCGYLECDSAVPVDAGSNVTKSTNSRTAKVVDPVSDLHQRLSEYPEYSQLCDLADELGYPLSDQ